jgi:hypothetical protein
MSDIILWILIFFVFIIILGLYISEYTPLDLDQKQKILMENFTSTSSSSDQNEGATELYGWGIPDNNTYNSCDHKCTKSCPTTCTQKCQTPPPPPPPPSPPKPVETCNPVPQNNNEVCMNCDITMNKNINKYILKSSVPACPDMSEYITKNMMNANPDLSDYILKSNIKACDKVDLTQYMLKSEVKPCDKVDLTQYMLKSEIKPCNNIDLTKYMLKSEIKPCDNIDLTKYMLKSEIKPCDNIDLTKYILKKDIPKCPKLREIHEHPDISKYISLEEVNKKYVLKDSVYNCDSAKEYLDKKCKNTQKSELLSDIGGYYAGDSLFAGV